MDIPYWSMIPAITEAGKGRETLSVIARSCAGVGFAVPVALTMAVVPLLGSGDERTGFAWLAVIISIVFILAISVTVKNVREVTQNVGKSPTIKDMFTSLIRNDQALVVVIAIVVFNSSLYLTQQLALYFFKYDIKDAALFGVFGTVGGLAQILSMMMLPVFKKKIQQ